MCLQSTAFMQNESASGDAAAREAGAAVQANTLSKKTKQTYCCALKALQEFGNSIDEIAEDREIFEATGELVVPMQMRLVELYFGHLASKRVPWNGTEKHLSVSSISLVTSAITSLHKSKRVKVNDDVVVYMTQFVKGYRRTIAEKKQANEYPMMEGKAFLGKDGLTALIEEGIKLGPGFRSQGGGDDDVDVDVEAGVGEDGGGGGGGPAGGSGGSGGGKSWSQATFFWSYLMLLWNTLARVASVGQLMLSHFSFRNGAITVKIPKCKNDQDGDHAFEKHIFANPLQPKYCGVLALAMRIWTMSLRDGGRLFPGATPERKFCDALSIVMERINDARRSLLQNIGAHSIKKGAITFLNGILGGPNAIAIELRADHHIGDVRSRYIFESVSQDMYIGRCLSMLPLHDVDFCCTAAQLHGECAIDWDAVLPIHGSFPSSFQPLLPVLLAQLVHHRAWLRQSLSPGHPLLMAHLFTGGVVDDLACNVRFERDLQGGGIPS
jgi:hypothetical protein